MICDFTQQNCRFSALFLLQLPFWCSNLASHNTPCFAGSIMGRPEQGYLFERANAPPPARRRFLAAVFSKPVDRHRDQIQKEDTRTYGKRKEIDKDAARD